MLKYLLLQLANPDNTAVKPNNDRLNVTNNLRIIPGTLGNVEMGVKYLFDTPVYWQLPKRFTGDKVTYVPIITMKCIKLVGFSNLIIRYFRMVVTYVLPSALKVATLFSHNPY